MIIKALAENTAASGEFGCEHGLSIYIETKNHKLLFDTGASGLFIENAQKLGIDMAAVDAAVISHGHYDHGGGLEAFLRANAKAKIYLHQKAFENHYSLRPGGVTAAIGLNEALIDPQRFVFARNSLQIDDELLLFSNPEGSSLPSLSNKTLMMEKNGGIIEDTFEHEQNLLITEGEKRVLIAGCAHRGIVNIIGQAVQTGGQAVDCVIGGFHLYNPSTKTSESPKLIGQIAKRLLKTGAKFYTCHCTGMEAYEQLKNLMNDRIEYLSSGGIIEI